MMKEGGRGQGIEKHTAKPQRCLCLSHFMGFSHYLETIRILKMANFLQVEQSELSFFLCKSTLPFPTCSL